MDVWRRVVWKNIDLLLSGLWVAVEVCVAAFAPACVAGLLVRLLGLYVRPLRWLALGYTQYCRNTPLPAQFMWVNYVWPELFG